MSTIIELRKQAQAAFPKRSAQFLRMSKAELETALQAGKLPEQGEKPVTATEKRCKWCEELITWSGGRGNWIPLNVDGTDHKATCTKWMGKQSVTPAVTPVTQVTAPIPVPVVQVETVPAPKPVPHRETAVEAFNSSNVTPPAPVQSSTIVAHDKPVTQAATQIADTLAALMHSMPGQVDANAVRSICKEVCTEMLASAGTGKQILSVSIGDLPAVEIDAQHESFPLLLAVVTARIPVMMIGPAGSGKTSAAHACANALNLPFRAMSVGPQTSKADLLGFKNAMGEYQSTPLRDLYENGGVFLLDEIDAGNPGVLTILNAALANDSMTFADGNMVKRHADFVWIAAANTFGNGADRQYVGRNQLDAATLDRFFNLTWDYDWSFTASLMGVKTTRSYKKLVPSNVSVEEWFKFVKACNTSLVNAGIRSIIGPRAALNGAKLLNVLDRQTLEEGLIWKGMPEIQRNQVKAGIR